MLIIIFCKFFQLIHNFISHVCLIFYLLFVICYYMENNSQIKLNTACLLNVPLHAYNKDFSFIVNGEEIKTSRLISDLLSPILIFYFFNK